VVRGSGLGLGLLLVVLITLVLQASVDVLVLVLVSILIAAAIDPLVGWVRSRVPASRVKIILTVYVLLVLLATVLAVLVVPALMNELSAISTRAPQLIADGREWAQAVEPEVIGSTVSRLIATVEATLMRGGITGVDPETVVEFGLTAADAALAVITVLTLVFFWLISRETMQRFALSLLPLTERASVRSGWNEVERRMGYWFRGQLTLMTVVGVMTTIGYLILGLENALLLGLIAGLTEIIPIVGPAIGAVPALISGFVAGGPELALLVAGVYVIVQVVEGQVLVPMVMKNAVGLPPFVVIVSLLVGGAVAGLIGALMAVPVAAAVVVVLERAQARETTVSLDTLDIESPDDDDLGADSPPVLAAEGAD
jgi:predicted PurR-regulated permease PerM